MDLKDQILGVIEARARDRLAELAGEMVSAKSEDKEDILAGIEFERWLADSCRDARRQE
jgi:hypothetical protein